MSALAACASPAFAAPSAGPPQLGATILYSSHGVRYWAAVRWTYAGGKLRWPNVLLHEHYVANAENYRIRWSPDGTRVAYSGGTVDKKGTLHEGLFVADTGGRHWRRLTSAVDFDPAWSPSGHTLVFARRTGSKHQKTWALWTIPSSGGTPRRVTLPPVRGKWWQRPYDLMPTWSNDGRTILFDRWHCTRRYCSGDLWSVPARGGKARLFLADASNAACSPNGRLIAFNGGHFRRNGLYVMRADRTHIRQIDPNPTAFMPSWSPSGRLLAYLATPSRRFHAPNWQTEVYVASPNGTVPPRRITHDRVDEYGPQWRPHAMTA